MGRPVADGSGRNRRRSSPELTREDASVAYPRWARTRVLFRETRDRFSQTTADEKTALDRREWSDTFRAGDVSTPMESDAARPRTPVRVSAAGSAARANFLRISSRNRHSWGVGSGLA